MSTAAPTASKTRRSARPAALATATLAATAMLLVPATAQAATTGGSVAEHEIVVTDAVGTPLAGETVEITATYPDLVDSTAYDIAKAKSDRLNAEAQAWFNSQHRPAQAAYDVAYQKLLAGTGTAAEWLATMPAQTDEMRSIEAKFAATALAQEQRAAGAATSQAKKTMLAGATETRSITTDGAGLAVAPTLQMGGGSTWPSAHVIGDGDDITGLPIAPQATTTIVLD